MIFVYLKNGERVDLEDAVSVVHRTQLAFLDADEQVVRQFPNSDVLAYSHALYREGDEINGLPPPYARRTTLLDAPDSGIEPRHRRETRRRRRRPSEQGTSSTT